MIPVITNQLIIASYHHSPIHNRLSSYIVLIIDSCQQCHHFFLPCPFRLVFVATLSSYRHKLLLHLNTCRILIAIIYMLIIMHIISNMNLFDTLVTFRYSNHYTYNTPKHDLHFQVITFPPLISLSVPIFMSSHHFKFSKIATLIFRVLVKHPKPQHLKHHTNSPLTASPPSFESSHRITTHFIILHHSNHHTSSPLLHHPPHNSSHLSKSLHHLLHFNRHTLSLLPHHHHHRPSAASVTTTACNSRTHTCSSSPGGTIISRQSNQRRAEEGRAVRV